MKKQILISLILTSSVLAMNAQWLGTNPVYTNSNVGVGIESPLYKVEWSNGTHIGFLDFTYSGNAIGSKNGALGLWTNNGERITILSNGNIGIGVPNPTFNLDVNGISHLNGHVSIGHTYNGQALNVGGNVYLIGGSAWVNDGFGFTTASLPFAGIYPNSTTGIGFNTNGSEKMRIDINGNLGIGVNSPNHKLTIQGVLGLYQAPGQGNSDNRNWTIQSSTLHYGDFSIIQSNAQDDNPSTNGTTRLYIDYLGKIGIKTTSPAYELDVIGTIRAREIIADLNGADFVFEKDYKLMPLIELEKFVKEQKHLPEIAPAKEMGKNGINLGNLNSKLLQKMEEMTLYMIEQNKEIQALKNEIKEMKAASK